MNQTSSTPALNAMPVDGDIIITGPDGFKQTLSPDEARSFLNHLGRAVEAAGVAQETYQKPLG